MSGAPRLVLVTRNPAKLDELRRVLTAARAGVDAVDLDEFQAMPDVAETGAERASSDSSRTIVSISDPRPKLSARFPVRFGRRYKNPQYLSSSRRKGASAPPSSVAS